MVGKFDLILLDEAEFNAYEEDQLEILDIYNENNTRIGAASRKAYIKLGLTTRAAHMLVFNSKGLVFLQKRSANKDTYPGYFSPSAAGHVGLGEEPELAASREMKEELGIESPVHFLGVFKCFKPENIVNQFYYFYVVRSDQPIKADKEEIASGGFYSLEQVKSDFDWEKFVPALKHELNRFDGDIRTWLENH